MTRRMLGLRIEDGTDKDPSLKLPPDEVGSLNFDLAELISAIGDSALSSEWRIHDLDCFGDSYSEFAAASASSRAISGKRLLNLAERITQIIDGEFVGHRLSGGGPWLVIKAVDSSWWEVWTADEVARSSLRRRFSAVSDIDEQAA